VEVTPERHLERTEGCAKLLIAGVPDVKFLSQLLKARAKLLKLFQTVSETPGKGPQVSELAEANSSPTVHQLKQDRVL
jgi:hypothetical protein